jgi:hypothetical protein
MLAREHNKKIQMTMRPDIWYIMDEFVWVSECSGVGQSSQASKQTRSKIIDVMLKLARGLGETAGWKLRAPLATHKTS